MTEYANKRFYNAYNEVDTMTIYLDVVLVENLCMNYIILFATGYLLKRKINHIRLILSALLGGIYSILAYMQILKIYSHFVLKILLSIVMVYLAYHAKNGKNFAKELLFFYLTSFVFGGSAFALLYFVKPEEIFMLNGSYVGTYPLKIALLGGLVGFTMTAIAFHFVKGKLTKKDVYCMLSIYWKEKELTIRALLDTGNMLKDPITSMPVIVVEKEALKEILPDSILENLTNIIGGDVPKEVYEDENLEYMTKFRVIPFRSLGKTNGMLLGVKVNKITIEQGEEKKTFQNIIVGIYEQKLSKKGQYAALIGLDLLEGSEENEFFANVSR